MVGRPGKYQPRFVAGELDALLQANTDEAIYLKGASRFRNVRPVPQGGFVNADGLMSLGRQRGRLGPLTLAGPSFPVVASGVAAGVLATWRLPRDPDFVAFDLTFGAAHAGGPAPTLTAPNPPLVPNITGWISAQYRVSAVDGWRTLDGRVRLSATLRTRRFALPAGTRAAAFQVRVLVEVDTPGTADVYLTAAAAWQEFTTISPARVRPFAVDEANAYDLVFTVNNVEVYSAAGRVASIAMRIADDEIAAFANDQSFDKMFLTHQNWAPKEIERQGFDDEWNIQDAQFSGVPRYDFGDVTYTNAIPAIWQLEFSDGFDVQFDTSTPPLPSGGVHYNISVNGTASRAQQQTPGNYTATAAQVLALVESIPGVAPGIGINQPAAHQINIQFQGAGNQGDGWAVSALAIDKQDAAITAAKLQVGVAGGEPIMSAARGWPSCCRIFQQRLLLAGFPQAPNAFIASEAGNVYEFDVTIQASTGPMLVVLDSLGDETITALHVGRTLDIFTTRGEYWMQPGILSKTAPPLIIMATVNGVAQGVEPLENEGATLYMHRNRGSLLEFRYDYSQQNYTSTNLSVVSSSLVQGVVDAALRRPATSTDTADIALVRADGSATHLSALRAEQVAAFAPRLTDGQFLAVDVNARSEMNFIVTRQVGGDAVNFLERVTSGLTLDGAVAIDVAEGDIYIRQLADAHEGASVWVYVDGAHQGPFVVNGGRLGPLFFPVLADGTAIVGRWTAPDVRTLPQPRDIAQRTVLRRPARVHTVRMTVVDTTSVAVGANDGPPYDAPLYQFGEPADVAPAQRPYTGWVLQEGLQGFSDDAIVRITQLRPGFLKVTGVVVEVDL